MIEYLNLRIFESSNLRIFESLVLTIVHNLFLYLFKKEIHLHFLGVDSLPIFVKWTINPKTLENPQ
jgi:hypothetical protein